MAYSMHLDVRGIQHLTWFSVSSTMYTPLHTNMSLPKCWVALQLDKAGPCPAQVLCVALFLQTLNGKGRAMLSRQKLRKPKAMLSWPMCHPQTQNCNSTDCHSYVMRANRVQTGRRVCIAGMNTPELMKHPEPNNYSCEGRPSHGPCQGTCPWQSRTWTPCSANS